MSDAPQPNPAAPQPHSSSSGQHPGSAVPPRPAQPAMPPSFAQPSAPQPPQNPYPSMVQPPAPGAYPNQPPYPTQPGFAGQIGYPGQNGYGATNAPYGAAPGGIKYNAAGKPKYPGLYLAAIIVLSIGLVAAIFVIVNSFAQAADVARVLGDSHRLTQAVMLLAQVSFVTLLVNTCAYVGIIFGFSWGRLVYSAVFVINIIVVVIIVNGIDGVDFMSGSMVVPIILPVLVIIALWVSPSTRYLKAMAQWRAGQRSQAPAF